MQRAFSLFLSSAFLLSSCTLSDRDRVPVHWVLPEKSQRDVALNSLDCFFLAVGAEDIEDTLSPGELGDAVDTGCLNLGQVSSLVDRATLTSTGVTLQVPRGNARRIRAIGLNVPGGQCQGSLQAQFAHSLPEMYVLGESVENLDGNKVVRLEDQTGEATDVLAQTCAPQVKDFLYVRHDSDKIARYELAPATGAILNSPLSTVATGVNSPPCVDPLGKYLAFAVPAKKIGLCLLDPSDGSADCTYSGAAPEDTTYCQFSPDGRFLYAGLFDGGTAGSIAVYEVDRDSHLLGDAIQVTPDIAGGAAPIGPFVVTKTDLHVSVSTSTSFLPRNPSTGFLSADTGHSVGIFAPQHHPFLDVLFGVSTDAVNPQPLKSAALTANLPNSEIGSQDFGLVTNSSIIGVCPFPNGKHLYATIFDFSGSAYLIGQQSLTAAGGFEGAATFHAGTGVDIYGPCRVHRSGRTAYFTSQSTNRMLEYRINATGTPTFIQADGSITSPNEFELITLSP